MASVKENRFKGWFYKGCKIENIEQLSKANDSNGELYGFIYKLTLIHKVSSEELYYYGRKNIFTNRKRKFTKKEISKMTDKRLKTYEYVKKEHDWIYYISSSTFIGENYSDYNIRKEILSFCPEDGDIVYEEAKVIICEDCLKDKKCINNGISIKRYRSDKK